MTSATLRFLRCLSVLAVLLGAVAPVSAAQAAPVETPRATSDPYKGDLSVFEYKDRDKKLQIGRVMDLLGITTGKAVADIGAGSGWFTVRAAERVGYSGVVYAEDINPDAIKHINQRISQEQLRNVQAVLGTPDNPRLPQDGVDAVLILKTYHEFAHPVPLMKNLKRCLTARGRIGIIDRNGTGTDHGIMAEVIEHEMVEAGFKLAGKYDFTKADGEDYFLIFTPR